MIYVILAGAVFFLAYTNGANDNFKGVATLFGSGTTNYKVAIRWATITTFVGSVAAILLATTLVKNFSGKGLVPDSMIQDPSFAISVALGAALTVFAATKIGMPISTTHSLVGGLAGVGLLAVGSAFNHEKLLSSFLIPLLLSPAMAATVSLLAYLFFRKTRRRMGITKESCICIPEPQTELEAQAIQVGSQKLDFQNNAKVTLGTSDVCDEVYKGSIFKIGAQKVLDRAHFISAGVVGFSRGLNDTPKIAALLLLVQGFDITWSLLAIGVFIGVGGLISARKVGETVSKKITPLNHGQGFTANLITGLLVTTASVHGMPVSTTHVSVGSIFGIGIVTRKANLKVVKRILLSWLFTLPVAAGFGALTYWILTSLL
jgi:PiT family inorganic phosphate transporter